VLENSAYLKLLYQTMGCQLFITNYFFSKSVHHAKYQTKTLTQDVHS